MLFSQAVTALVALPLAACYLVAPPTGSTAAPETVEDCSEWVVATAASTCLAITEEYEITIAYFEQMNPILGSSCTLLNGFAFCVQENFGSSSSTSSVASSTTFSTVTTSSSTTTSSGNGITTPTPYQTGMTTSCDAFHLVVSMDSCADIASAAGISLASFYIWNPAVGSSCEYLDLGDYVCINVIGGTSTTSSVATTTTPGNGITTPTPYQTGMTTACDSFHLVVSMDSCSAIASAAGVSLANFYTWNPAVGSTCEYLDLGDYVCINVIGGSTSSSVVPTTTSSGNGIATPTPYQTGMVGNCDVFHLVVENDGCQDIATTAGISLATFYLWNPAVGNTCAYLDLGDYVCIGIV